MIKPEEREFFYAARDAFEVLQPQLYAILKELVAAGKTKARAMRECKWQDFVGAGRADLVKAMVRITLDVLLEERDGQREANAGS